MAVDPVDTIRRVGLRAALALALGGFAAYLGHQAPVADWLVARYLGYWLLALLFAAACLSSGHALVVRILGGVLPLFEQIAVSFAVGVYLFYLGSTLGGLLGLYGSTFFFALPVALVAAGARPTLRHVRRAVRHLRGAWRRSPRRSPWGLLVYAVGGLGLLLVYFAILTPNNVGFDGRWQHVALAEHYVALGAIRRFPEGWYFGTQPHLAALLYAWALLLPAGGLADRIELAAHLEMTIFVFTLPGVTAIFRRLVRPAGGPLALYRYAWAARFLFPGVLLYDSSLCLGADHVAAVFAAPIFLLLLRAWPRLAPRACVLLAITLAGALLTKYTAGLVLVVPAIAVFMVRAVGLGLPALLRRVGAPSFRTVCAGPLAALVCIVVATAPHWATNAAWYGDPIYPLLHAHLTPHPWTADSANRLDVGLASMLWRPERSLAGVARTLGVLATFSFVPNDWPAFHGTTPVFGSLFTLCLAALPFLRGTRRLWGLYGLTHMGIFVWYWTHHQDRYLQTALPWMAAATAAVLALLWQRGGAVRVAACGLAALQIVWGAGVYFIPAHVYLGVPARAVIDLFSRPRGRADPGRFVFSDPFVAIGRALPPKAVPLIHEWHTHLGIEAPSVSDCPYHQGGISYQRTPEPRQIFDQLREYGVTHLVYRTMPSREPDTLAGEIVFANFASRAAGTPRRVAGWLVAPMPETAPARGGAPDPVLVITCGDGPAPGLYHLADLTAPPATTAPLPAPFERGSPSELLPEAVAVAQRSKCSTLPDGMKESFAMASTTESYAIWIRGGSRSPPKEDGDAAERHPESPPPDP